MEELDAQLSVLINDAANYGVSPVVIERAIAPVLKAFASQLQHLEYYVLQNMQENWVLTTIANPQLDRQKKVIYAFKSVRDAGLFAKTNQADAIAMPIAIAQLLWRLVALQQVDSIIFLEDSHNLNRGTEVERNRLLESIQKAIEKLETPPHIA